MSPQADYYHPQLRHTIVDLAPEHASMEESSSTKVFYMAGVTGARHQRNIMF